jgi:hypothetical protein
MKKLKNFLNEKFQAIKKAWIQGMVIQGQNLMLLHGAYGGKPVWGVK